MTRIGTFCCVALSAALVAAPLPEIGSSARGEAQRPVTLNPFAGDYRWGPVPITGYVGSILAYPRAYIRVIDNGRVLGEINLVPIGGEETRIGALRGSVSETGEVDVRGRFSFKYYDEGVWNMYSQSIDITGIATLDPVGSMVITTATGVIVWQAQP